MKRNKLAILCVSLFFFFTISAQKQFKALLVTTTKGWHHESLHYGVVAIKELAVRNFFEVVLFEDPNSFNDKFLEQFQVVIFLNTTGDIFDSTQQKVMERFIQSGKGFVGIHSASDTEYDWDWYTKLVGRMFHIHPTIQTAKLKIFDDKFPGLQGFSDGSTYNPKADWGAKKGQGMGQMHPVAWYHMYDGGRSFYTALGHMPTDFSDPAFLNHLYAGIFWAATGKK